MLFRLSYLSLIHQNSSKQGLGFRQIRIKRYGIAQMWFAIGSDLQSQNGAKLIFGFSFGYGNSLRVLVEIQFLVQLICDVMIRALFYIILQFLLHGSVIDIE